MSERANVVSLNEWQDGIAYTISKGSGGRGTNTLVLCAIRQILGEELKGLLRPMSTQALDGTGTHHHVVRVVSRPVLQACDVLGDTMSAESCKSTTVRAIRQLSSPLASSTYNCSCEWMRVESE